MISGRRFEGDLTDDSIRGMALDGSYLQDRIISEIQYDAWLEDHDDGIRRDLFRKLMLDDSSRAKLCEAARNMMDIVSLDLTELMGSEDDSYSDGVKRALEIIFDADEEDGSSLSSMVIRSISDDVRSRSRDLNQKGGSRYEDGVKDVSSILYDDIHRMMKTLGIDSF